MTHYTLWSCQKRLLTQLWWLTHTSVVTNIYLFLLHLTKILLIGQAAHKHFQKALFIPDLEKSNPQFLCQQVIKQMFIAILIVSMIVKFLFHQLCTTCDFYKNIIYLQANYIPRCSRPQSTYNSEVSMIPISFLNKQIEEFTYLYNSINISYINALSKYLVKSVEQDKFGENSTITLLKFCNISMIFPIKQPSHPTETEGQIRKQLQKNPGNSRGLKENDFQSERRNEKPLWKV